MKPRDYDSTVARIAGTILSAAGRSLLEKGMTEADGIGGVKRAVWLARAIVNETRRTEPDPRIEQQAEALKQPAKAEAGAL